jgi:hypothetical protein
MMQGKCFLRLVLCGVGSTVLGLVALMTTAATAIAAEKIVFRQGVFEQTLTVQELEAFAQTGQTSSPLGDYLKSQPPLDKVVPQALNQEIGIGVIQMDKALNNPIADLILDRVGEVIRLPNGDANRQALRAALVNSVSQDGRFTLIEVIKNYPANEVIVDGDRLSKYQALLNSLGTLLPK